MAAGRPTDYTDELAGDICTKLGNGQSLRSICAADDMPTRQTVHNWLNANSVFFDQYTRAREIQADTIFDECLDIADSQEGDMIVVDGEDRVNHDVIARAKLRIDTRKWMAGKLRPKAYGDKSAIEHTSPDGSMTPTVIYQLPDNGRSEDN